MSNNDVEMIKRIYASFNARDIDAVLAVLSDDVAWANGMDGGHINGREAVLLDTSVGYDQSTRRAGRI
jgi:ketosteroid isomerase-like protein